MNTSILSNLIFEKYGTVTRARNCFLYTKKGVRLTDLFQENGRAVLGWDGKSSFTFLKNVLNRAQVGSFICEEKPRINKAVSCLLNSECTVFYFSSKKDALQAGLSISPQATSVYKPWNTNDIDWNTVDCTIIVPPLPWTDTIYLLAVKNDKLEKQEQKKFPSQIKIPFAMETAVTRSIYNLVKALQEREEKNWFIYDTVVTKYWTRKGPYLFPKISEDKYDEFVKHCLNCELVINPSYNEPSIVPFGADKGVFTKLKNNPFEL